MLMKVISSLLSLIFAPTSIILIFFSLVVISLFGIFQQAWTTSKNDFLSPRDKIQIENIILNKSEQLSREGKELPNIEQLLFAYTYFFTLDLQNNKKITSIDKIKITPNEDKINTLIDLEYEYKEIFINHKNKNGKIKSIEKQKIWHKITENKYDSKYSMYINNNHFDTKIYKKYIEWKLQEKEALNDTFKKIAKDIIKKVNYNLTKEKQQSALSNSNFIIGETKNMKWPVLSSFPISAHFWDFVGFPPEINHTGVDISVPSGTSVVAPFDCQIIKVYSGLNAYGNALRGSANVNGKKITFMLAHNTVVFVKVGEHIKAGQQVALSGNTGNSTGAHVHFDIRPIEYSATDFDQIKSHYLDPIEIFKNTTHKDSLDAKFEQVAICESGNNPNAVAHNNIGYGDHYGLYQFDIPTWKTNGGSKYASSPLGATPSEQLEIAKNLYHSRGWSPWECATKLGIK